MCLNMKLPVGEFKFLKKKEYKDIDWRHINTNEDYGYIVECDLIYPHCLHDEHADFPLAPIKSKISKELLSEQQKLLSENLKAVGHKNISTEKLILNLYDKKKYIVHFKNLKLYLKLGLKLGKVHRVLSFRQAEIFKKYIDLNTQLRQNANNDFKKDLYKLMNNALYGKTLEDVRKQFNVLLGLTEKQCIKHIRTPYFKECSIISEDIALFKLSKKVTVLNKPIAIGFTVLENAKNYMYSLHYQLFKKHYGDKLKLLYTDTGKLNIEMFNLNLISQYSIYRFVFL